MKVHSLPSNSMETLFFFLFLGICQSGSHGGGGRGAGHTSLIDEEEEESSFIYR